MIRAASRRVGAWKELRSVGFMPPACGRQGLAKIPRLPARVKVATFSASQDLLDDTGYLDSESDHFQSNSVPQPVLALAYDYVDEDEDGHEFVTQAENNTLPIYANAAGGSGPRPQSSSSYPAPGLKMSETKRSGGNGGGGSGRYRCPKCGTFVTFRHNDFGTDTFYCATCSGWYVISPNTPLTGRDDGKKAPPAFLDTTVLMQHIPDDPKIYTTQRPVDTPSSRGPDGDGERMQHRLHEIKRMPTPREIMKGLNEYVIGQRLVKVALSVGVYNHYKRIFVSESQALAAERQKESEEYSMNSDGPSLSEMGLDQFGKESRGSGKPFCEAPDVNSITDGEFGRDVEDCEIDKSNIMLLGPTGSGKTHVVKTLARLIDVPLVIADATCLTQAGYVGEDVESILFKLYLESGQDIERCQRGIVYIDECDKVRKSGGNISISRDVSGEGVQHALLKIVEGNVINVPKEPGRKNPRNDFLQIDTTNVLFICGGAFSGLERIINRRMDAASIGFGAQMKKAIDDPKVQGKYFESAIPKDLVEYGMIPEFVGRFPVIVSTKGLDIANLVDILTVPKNAIMKQYRRLFAMDDVNFHVTEDALAEIAKTAFSRGTGARGLRSITDAVLMETQYVVPSMPSVHTVYVDAQAVTGERKPILFKDPNMTVEKYEALMQQGQSVVDGAVSVNIEEDTEIEREEAA